MKAWPALLGLAGCAPWAHPSLAPTWAQRGEGAPLGDCVAAVTAPGGLKVLCEQEDVCVVGTMPTDVDAAYRDVVETAARSTADTQVERDPEGHVATRRFGASERLLVGARPLTPTLSRTVQCVSEDGDPSGYARFHRLLLDGPAALGAPVGDLDLPWGGEVTAPPGCTVDRARLTPAVVRVRCETAELLVAEHQDDVLSARDALQTLADPTDTVSHDGLSFDAVGAKVLHYALCSWVGERPSLCDGPTGAAAP